MIYKLIQESTAIAFRDLYGKKVDSSSVQVQKTRPDFEGDITVVAFPLARFSSKTPGETASSLGLYLKEKLDEVESFNVVKGFLNLVIRKDYWTGFLQENWKNESFGIREKREGKPVVIEFSSPNTNKPLHLGHVRNILLGWSLARILESSGEKVVRVNLVNDRGIHICKTMLAFNKWMRNETPESQGKKGDKFVGDLYVKFEKENKVILQQLVASGQSEEEAYRNSPLVMEAMQLLQEWEDGKKEVRELWAKLNSWVYSGFDRTYERLGTSFDKIYYESDTYLLGKELVEEGLKKGNFFKKEDGSVWADLSGHKLDEKLLLRTDGTSVYITQDLGTAQLRHDDFDPSQLLYVVGNEQNYHFEVLKILLEMLGRPWANDITHVSYGMVELPHGRMKSREGTVVDADDLLDEMHVTARKMTIDLGKLEGFSPEESEELFEIIGQGALKFFILKVDPKKNMLFNPEESIDFNGNTGPFIQYTHARISSLLRKAKERGKDPAEHDEQVPEDILPKERSILKNLYQFPTVITEAARNLSPALLANYVYELAREYNQFYQEVNVLREEDVKKMNFRLRLSSFTATVIRRSMDLLGITVPDRM